MSDLPAVRDAACLRKLELPFKVAKLLLGERSFGTDSGEVIKRLPNTLGKELPNSVRRCSNQLGRSLPDIVDLRSIL